jgi:hypothetical protein
MRAIQFAFATALAVCISAPIYAQNLPSDAQCHVLARQRGAGESSGNRNHEAFIRACVSGKVTTTTAAIPEPVRELRGMTDEYCHELARERGAGESSGNRNHERFIRNCMAGKVAANEVRNRTQEYRRRSEAECDVLSRQRGSGEGTGNRNHQRFVRACMEGKVS